LPHSLFPALPDDFSFFLKKTWAESFLSHSIIYVTLTNTITPLLHSNLNLHPGSKNKPCVAQISGRATPSSSHSFQQPQLDQPTSSQIKNNELSSYCCSIHILRLFVFGLIFSVSNWCEDMVFFSVYRYSLVLSSQTISVVQVSPESLT
jgi:hypothetical protein